MDQKWIHILVILTFYQKITSGAGKDVPLKEGQQVEIKCQLETKSLVIWFRVLDKLDIEFIATFTTEGFLKAFSTSYSQSFTKTTDPYVLTLKAFNKRNDSGIYICASIYNGKELKFGEVTRLFGENKDTTGAPPTTKRNLSVTTTPCVCKDKNKQGASSPSMFCAPIILGPLAGGCGLLLLLLIITTLYCNRIRTRRCPHHYKRKLRTVAPEKQMMTNRHV